MHTFHNPSGSFHMYNANNSSFQKSQETDQSDGFLSNTDLEILEKGLGPHIADYTHRSLVHAVSSIAGVVCTDSAGYIIHANDLFCKENNCELKDIIGKRNSIFKSGRHSKEFYDNMWKHLRARKSWRGELCNRTLDGSLRWMDTTITSWHTNRGEFGGYLALRLDVSARKQAEATALEENRKRLEMETLLNDIVATVPNGILAYDSEGRISFFNKASQDLYADLAPGMAIGRRRQDVVDAVVLRDIFASDNERPRTNGTNALPQQLLHPLPDGRWVQVQNRKSPSGTLVSVQTDVTEVKRIEEQITLQAERDSLTGLFNRQTLLNRLSQITDASQTEPCTLALIDFDDFKAINDGLGHDAGDKFLFVVAQRLKSAVRDTDVVARLGGDEFAVLLPGVHNPDSIKTVMMKLHRALADPIRIGGQILQPSASMGIASFPQDGETPVSLMKSADFALYRCKRDGRGHFRVYDSAMRRERQRRETLTGELRKALEEDAFTVVLQPQIDIATGRHTGFEALVRWRLSGRWIPPEELISIAEEAGLVTRLSYQIVEKTLAIMARLKRACLKPGIVGLNVVATQLHEPNFAKNLLGLLRKYGVAPSEIEIEITEHVILDRSSKNIERVLRRLHGAGMAIALDDFGTGYASLTHLKRFPVTRLKIDRSFIGGLPEDADDHVIVRTIISLAHNLGLKVVAEGIETPEQLEELTKLGCDCAQGYLIGRPMDESAAARYCEPSNRNAAA